MDIFNESSTSVDSLIFAVPPGKAMVIRLFGFGCDQKLMFNNVDITAGARHYTHTPCGSSFTQDDPITEVAPIVKCSARYLSGCDNTGVITLPGTYQFTMSDPTAVGVTKVTAEYIGLAEANAIPDSLKLG